MLRVGLQKLEIVPGEFLNLLRQELRTLARNALGRGDSKFRGFAALELCQGLSPEAIEPAFG